MMLVDWLLNVIPFSSFFLQANGTKTHDLHTNASKLIFQRSLEGATYLYTVSIFHLEYLYS